MNYESIEEEIHEIDDEHIKVVITTVWRKDRFIMTYRRFLSSTPVKDIQIKEEMMY